MAIQGYSPEKISKLVNHPRLGSLVIWDIFFDLIFEFLQVPPKSQGKASHVQVGIKDNGGIQKQEEIVSQYENELIFHKNYDSG